MRKIVENLVMLQRLQFGPDAAGKTAEIEKLSAEVPPPVLGHYQRLVVRGKKGVAIVRHGVCTECHLRITSAKLVILCSGADIQLCDNCGRYLYLPPEEAALLSEPKQTTPPPRKTRARRTPAHAA